MTSKTLDFLILGSGYTGSLAALVLARKGYSVATVDRGTHPRFAIGESTTPEQTYMLDWLGLEHGIPELRRLSSYELIKHDGLPIAVWPKESLYFLFNPALFPGAPAEFMHQTHPWPAGPAYHCLRADLDLHLFELARKYGAEHHVRCEIKDLDLSGELASARLATPDGDLALEARFVLDATGPGCFLAEKLGLRVPGEPFGGLRSWSVYSHFKGVKPIEATWARGWPGAPLPRDNSTLQHLSPDAWTWVIPFDNGVTSVGTVFFAGDEARAARAPREFFEEHARANPAFAAMMDGAEAIRPFTFTGPLQWRSRAIAGRNWLILPPASGFTDPYLSPGQMLSSAAVGRFSLAVDSIMKEGRSAADALAFMQARHDLESAHIARIIHSSFLSFRHPFLFEQAQSLYWLMLAYDRGVSAKPLDGGPDLLPAQWAAGDDGFRALTVEFERRLLEGRGSAPETLARELGACLRRGDRHALLPPSLPRIRLTTLAHAEKLARLRRRTAAEHGGAPARQAGPVKPLEGLRHALEVLARKPFERRTPRSAGALRMFARHLRIALLGG